MHWPSRGRISFSIAKLDFQTNHFLCSAKSCHGSVRKTTNTVPYRESKLTFLLREHFTSGMSLIRMIICMSLSGQDADENVQVLQFARRAKDVLLPPPAPEPLPPKKGKSPDLDDEERQLLDRFKRPLTFTHFTIPLEDAKEEPKEARQFKLDADVVAKIDSKQLAQEVEDFLSKTADEADQVFGIINESCKFRVKFM